MCIYSVRCFFGPPFPRWRFDSSTARKSRPARGPYHHQILTVGHLTPSFFFAFSARKTIFKTNPNRTSFRTGIDRRRSIWTGPKHFRVIIGVRPNRTIVIYASPPTPPGPPIGPPIIRRPVHDDVKVSDRHGLQKFFLCFENHTESTRFFAQVKIILTKSVGRRAAFEWGGRSTFLRTFETDSSWIVYFVTISPSVHSIRFSESLFGEWVLRKRRIRCVYHICAWFVTRFR